MSIVKDIGIFMVDDDKIVNKWRKRRLIGFIILICSIVILCIIFGLVGIFSYRKPKSLRETTGTIIKVKQHDEKWYDTIFNNPGSYLKIWLADGRCFEAAGIAYYNIDKVLFENISIGEEIKITYDPRHDNPYRIYAIEYNGVKCMLKDKVLDDFEDNSKTMIIIGAAIIAFSTTVGAVALSIVFYKYKNKHL